MGMQDRDWYREVVKERIRREEQQEQRAQRRARMLNSLWTAEPRDAPKNHGWHWSLILIVWAVVICLLAIVFKFTR